MKARLHPMFEQISGQMGELVYRVVRGRTIISRKPLVSAEGPPRDKPSSVNASGRRWRTARLP